MKAQNKNLSTRAAHFTITLFFENTLKRAWNFGKQGVNLQSDASLSKGDGLYRVVIPNNSGKRNEHENYK